MIPEPGVTPTPARLTPLREFIATENASAIILLVATFVALAWANSPWAAGYERLWSTELALRLGEAELSLDLRHWINDGLMALFFFVVGLEVRRELDMGELRERRRVATSVIAAIGGMTLPALIYLAFNANTPGARGWGIVMATDTAFALGVLGLVGTTASRARTFLLTVMIVDDVVALTIIALAYTGALSVTPLVVAVAGFGLMMVLRRAGVRNGVVYFLLGVVVWLGTLASGVHATIAGVAIGVLAAAYPPSRDDLQKAGRMWRTFREVPTPSYARAASRSLAQVVSPNERLQHLYHPWTSYFIVPVFALANAGIELGGHVVGRAATSRITLGIIAGLVVGKIIGVTGVTWLASRPRLGQLPLSVSLGHVAGVGAVSGIGFTVSLLIADISFDGPLLEEAKIGIFVASILASVLTWAVFALVGRFPQAGSRSALPIVDLAEPVDPELDHVRGRADAPVVLVEYGDFDCPYCAQAEPVIRRLVEEHGDDVAFVFRHLPLDDVHPQARLAAEACEAASAQGRFWEMHDVLIDQHSLLSEDDIFGYARALGLDMETFVADVRAGRYADRVERDVRSADQSGAAGTPTFFLNGRRYQGTTDLEPLSRAVRHELAHVPFG